VVIRPREPEKLTYAIAIRKEVIFDSHFVRNIQDSVLFEKVKVTPPVNKLPVFYQFYDVF